MILRFKTSEIIMNKSAGLLVGALVSLFSVAHGSTVITQWNFEAQNLGASTGLGTATLFGGTTSSFAANTGGGFGWNTTTYAAQGTGSGTRGVQFLVDTTNYQDMTMTFQLRATSSASRWAQVDYTLDGSNWVTGFWNNNGGLSPQDTYNGFTVDFSSIAGADQNPNFGVRVVSVFSPQAFDQSASLADFGANAAYMRASTDASFLTGGGLGTGNYTTSGAWRFDDVTFSGTAVPEPSRLLLLGAGLVLGACRRRHSLR
jgi:hypothetical protein